MYIITKVYYVEGMHCNSCKDLIEDTLKETNGILSIEADYATNKVNVSFDEQIVNEAYIEMILEQLGYPLAKNESKLKENLIAFAIFSAIIVTLIVLEKIGLFSLFIPEGVKESATTSGATIPILFIIGFFTSFHCIAMCGGINISQCSKVVTKQTNVLPSVLYNSGRLISYTIVGGIVGLIGSVLIPSGAFKGIVILFASIFMLIMGLNHLGIFRSTSKFMPRIPKKLAKNINKGKSGKSPFVVGLLNGLMPCGPLQAIQLYALSTGSFIMGATSMFFFALGTIPVMFCLGAISTYLSSKFTYIMLKVSGGLVIFLGFIMLGRGLALLGF